MTLADFWGAEKVFSEMDDDKGLSLVLVQSPKGKALLSEAEKLLTVKSCDATEALAFNSAATASVATPPQRDAFMSAISQKDTDFMRAAQPFLRLSMKQRIRMILSKVKRKLFRR